jgi:hypothetical protein
MRRYKRAKVCFNIKDAIGNYITQCVNCNLYKNENDNVFVNFEGTFQEVEHDRKRNEWWLK